MTKIFIFIVIGFLFLGCTDDTKKQEIGNDLTAKDSTVNFNELNKTVDFFKKTLEMQSSKDINLFKSKKESKLLKLRVNQLSQIISGLQIMSNIPEKRYGKIIDTTIFEKNAKKMQLHVGLGILHGLGCIHGFEIGKADIIALTKNQDYTSIRAYPIKHPDYNNSLTYALVALKGEKNVSNSGIRLREDLSTLSDTWDPWPPITSLSSNVIDSTLLRFYYRIPNK